MVLLHRIQTLSDHYSYHPFLLVFEGISRWVQADSHLKVWSPHRTILGSRNTSRILSSLSCYKTFQTLDLSVLKESRCSALTNPHWNSLKVLSKSSDLWPVVSQVPPYRIGSQSEGLQGYMVGFQSQQNTAKTSNITWIAEDNVSGSSFNWHSLFTTIINYITSK